METLDRRGSERKSTGGARESSTQIYPRSFADANGDGIGDLQGVIDHLEHLEWLGVDGIWLSPVSVSPNADFGYDVADYCDVDPDYGDLATLDRLVTEAGRRGIPRPDGSRAQPHERTATGGSKTPGPPKGPPPRLLRLGRWPARRRTAQQLGQHLRWRRHGPSTRRPGSTTCHNFLPEQPDLTGGTPRCATPSTTSCGSGGTGASPGSASMSATWSSRTPPYATTHHRGPVTPFIEQMFGQRWLYNANRPEVTR